MLGLTNVAVDICVIITTEENVAHKWYLEKFFKTGDETFLRSKREELFCKWIAVKDETLRPHVIKELNWKRVN